MRILPALLIIALLLSACACSKKDGLGTKRPMSTSLRKYGLKSRLNHSRSLRLTSKRGGLRIFCTRCSR